MPMLATVADDFTGASDQASMLAGAGVSSLLVLDEAFDVSSGHWQAITYASRLRSIAPEQARALGATLFARAAGLQPRMIQYKYCSTFDSTPEGNIGPCLDVAMQTLGPLPGAVVVPALPVNGRTTYQGRHFVLGVPLDESPMRQHPLNPMTDANLVRWLGRQTQSPVGLVSYETVEKGPAAITDGLKGLWAEGIPYVVVDCLSQRHVRVIAQALWDQPFISGSSALPMELPGVWRKEGLLEPARQSHVPEGAPGDRHDAPVLALSGSCAAQTLRQVQCARGFHLICVDLDTVIEGDTERESRRLVARADEALREGGRALVSSSQSPQDRAVSEARAKSAGLSPHELGRRIEGLMGEVARQVLAHQAVLHLLVAGGETSGAVCQALGLRAVEILTEIAPGVPLCRSIDEPHTIIALKGGNFGGDDFFPRAAAAALGARWG